MSLRCGHPEDQTFVEAGTGRVRCRRCRREKDARARERNGTRGTAWAQANPDRAREGRRAKHARIRQEAMENLGGACAVCGAVEALELDHIEPLRGDRPHQEGEWQRAARGDTDGLQLLCHEDHRDKTTREMSK